MPIEVIKYTCQFKCGKKAVGHESGMRGHESQCWKNPANQTCKTCTNEIYEYDYDNGKQSIYRGCKIDSLNEVFESVNDILKFQNTMHVRPIYKCQYWNKNDDDKSKEFADLLDSEIRDPEEGTKHYPYFNKPKIEMPF